MRALCLLSLALLLLPIFLLLASQPALADAPELVVTEPKENDEWSGTENVVWVVRDNEGGQAEFVVDYSYDGGITWIELATRSDHICENWTEYRYEFNTVEQDDTTSARVRVKVVDNEDNTAAGQSGVFEIKNRLSPPTLQYPADEASIKQTNPVLEWREAEGPATVENYQVQLATDPGFESVAYATTVQLTGVTVERYLNDDWYYWRVRVHDSRGAVSEWSEYSSFEIYTRPPIVTSFSINSGATYTRSKTVQLEFTEINVSHLSLSSDGINWSEWSPYSSDTSFQLTGEDGAKNVYVRGKDVTGRVSDIEVAEIILDTHPPTTAVNLSGAAGSAGYRGSVAISFISSDSLSGVDEVYYRVDGGEWRTGSSFVLAADGEHEVEYYATDLAGNSEQIRTQSVRVYTPVTPFPWYPVLGIAAAGIAGAVAGWYKLIPRWRNWKRRRFLMSRWMRGLFELSEEEEEEG